MLSFPQVSPPKPCAHLSLPPYVPHRQRYTCFKNIYSLRNTFTYSFNLDVSETDRKLLEVPLQYFPSCQFACSSPNKQLASNLVTITRHYSKVLTCWDSLVISTGLIRLRADSRSKRSLACCSTAMTKASCTLLFCARSNAVTSKYEHPVCTE